MKHQFKALITHIEAALNADDTLTSEYFYGKYFLDTKGTIDEAILKAKFRIYYKTGKRTEQEFIEEEKAEGFSVTALSADTYADTND